MADPSRRGGRLIVITTRRCPATMRWAAVPNTRIQSMQRAEIIDTRGERLGWMQFSAPGGASDNDKN